MNTASGIVSGSQSFKPSRFEGSGMRFLKFRKFLTDLKATVDHIDHVSFEEVHRHKGVAAAHCYGGFMAHLTEWCEHHNIPYQGVPVSAIKTHVTGKGNASKSEVQKAVIELGYKPEDDNEADALALLLFAMENAE